MRIIKAIEISLMVLAAIAFMNHSYAALFAVLFLMGCQSTLFGPAKYAYLPQQLGTTELIGGNALVESGTYLAIIFGLIIGGISVAIDPGEQYVLSACLIGVAIFGYLASRGIPETRAVDPHLRINWNVWTETWHIVGFAREDRSVYLAILGISWFWFFGSAMTLQIPAYTLDIMNGNEKITTMLLVTFAVGVGIGSLLCERLSGHRIELGLVPFGSIGLSVFAIDLYFAQSAMHDVAVTTVREFVNRPGSVRILADLTMLGAFGGTLQCANVRHDTGAGEAPALIANHCREQHYQCDFHGRCCSVRAGSALCRPVHSGVFRSARPDECRRCHLYLHARSRIPDEIHRVDTGELHSIGFARAALTTYRRAARPYSYAIM